jgi:hypothetical protein
VLPGRQNHFLAAWAAIPRGWTGGLTQSATYPSHDSCVRQLTSLSFGSCNRLRATSFLLRGKQLFTKQCHGTQEDMVLGTVGLGWDVPCPQHALVSCICLFSPHLQRTRLPRSSSCVILILVPFLVGLQFELRALHLQSRHSTAGARPPVHFVLVILEMGTLDYLPGWPQISILLISASPGVQDYRCEPPAPGSQCSSG